MYTYIKPQDILDQSVNIANNTTNIKQLNITETKLYKNHMLYKQLLFDVLYKYNVSHVQLNDLYYRSWYSEYRTIQTVKHDNYVA